MHAAERAQTHRFRQLKLYFLLGLPTEQEEDVNAIAALLPYKVFPGNRPTNTFLFYTLNPKTLGSLIALYVRVGIGQVQVGPAQRWLVDVPFSIYLGWITVATVANATSLCPARMRARLMDALAASMATTRCAVAGCCGLTGV